MKSKYYVRVVRPTFQRAILTVVARSEEAAVRSALGEAEQLLEADCAELGVATEPPVLEMVLSEEEAEEAEGVPRRIFSNMCAVGGMRMLCCRRISRKAKALSSRQSG
jgi:hypothetical protein